MWRFSLYILASFYLIVWPIFLSVWFGLPETSPRLWIVVLGTAPWTVIAVVSQIFGGAVLYNDYLKPKVEFEGAVQQVYASFQSHIQQGTTTWVVVVELKGRFVSDGPLTTLVRRLNARLVRWQGLSTIGKREENIAYDKGEDERGVILPPFGRSHELRPTIAIRLPAKFNRERLDDGVRLILQWQAKGQKVKQSTFVVDWASFRASKESFERLLASQSRKGSNGQ